MKSLIIGLIILAAATFVILPVDCFGIGLTWFGLGWGVYVVSFLKGGAPVIAILIGLIVLFIGIADIKDRAEAKKEEKEKTADTVEKE